MSHAPEDDAERLVLADELLARGDARGELIVVQCELARARALLDSRLATQLEMIDLRHSKETLEPYAEELRGLWDGQLLF